MWDQVLQNRSSSKLRRVLVPTRDTRSPFSVLTSPRDSQIFKEKPDTKPPVTDATTLPTTGQELGTIQVQVRRIQVSTESVPKPRKSFKRIKLHAEVDEDTKKGVLSTLTM
jgi:hypothetical protein